MSRQASWFTLHIFENRRRWTKNGTKKKRLKPSISKCHPVILNHCIVLTHAVCVLRSISVALSCRQCRPLICHVYCYIRNSNKTFLQFCGPSWLRRSGCLINRTPVDTITTDSSRNHCTTSSNSTAVDFRYKYVRFRKLPTSIPDRG